MVVALFSVSPLDTYAAGGELYSWGDNYAGSFGANTPANSTTPLLIAGLDDFTDIESSGYNTAAIKSDGSVWIWGENIASPLQVPGITNVVNIDINRTGVFMVRNDGSLWIYKPLGATLEDTGFTNVVKVDSQHNGPLALYTDTSGNLFEFDDDPAGAYSATQITGITDVIDMDYVETGFNYIAVTSTGTVYTWGVGSTQLYGNGSGPVQPNPTVLATIDNIVEVEAGVTHFAALRNDGTVFTWGSNFDGELGRTGDATLALPVPGLGVVETLDVGGWYNDADDPDNTLVILNDGTLWGWGNNAYGQLGIGNTTSPVTSPVQITALNGLNIQQVSASGQKSHALTAVTASSFTCGANNISQTATSANTSVCVTVNAGVATMYAGDDIDNDDICTPGDDATTIESVACDVTERSSTLEAKTVLNVRQETNSVVHDIILEDLRGLQLAQYDIDVSMCDLVGDQTTPQTYPLGYTGDGTGTGLYARVDADTNGVISALKPQSTTNAYTGGENTNWSKGSDTSVTDTTTQIAVYNTTADVTPGRYEIDDVDFGFELPAYIEIGNYTCDVTWTLTL
jgi:hypothetical protein